MHFDRTLTVTLAALTMLGAAPAAAQTAPAAAAFEEVEGLRITELTIAHNIEGGQAVEPATTFTTSDGRVSVLIRLENTTGAEADIRVSFERADREVVSGEGAGTGGVTLHLPAQRRYRTQARTGTRAAGRYRVVVRTSTGAVLGTAEYEVTG